ncbi:reverse transcriptase domain-containing protein [Tanacetum coccineum]
MRTLSFFRSSVEPSTKCPEDRRNKKRSQQQVDPTIVEEKPIVTIDRLHRNMALLLPCTPEGNGEAIVKFLMLYSFCSTRLLLHIKYKDVPFNDLSLCFSISIVGYSPNLARERNLLAPITTWDDLVSKSINKFFPPSKTTNLRNEISNFEQRFDEPFHERWDRFKDLLRFASKKHNPPPVSVKAVEESCVTCGGPHPYYQCPDTNGNAFLGYHDNIQAYVSAAAIAKCLALADLGASINLMPLSIWKKLSLPKLTPTQMIIDCDCLLLTEPALAEDVYEKRHFLRTARALINVYGEELTLRVGDEAITFKVGNTSKFSYNDAESINRIDVIDVACEEYSQEVLGFSGNSESGNPTLISEPIIAKSSPSLTPFEGGDFILEEIESDSVPPGIDSEDISEFFSTFPIPVEDSDFFLEKPKTFPSELETFRFDIKEKNSGSTTDHADVSLPIIEERFYSEGDIRLLEKFLNNDPSSPLLPKEIKAVELKNEKSSVNEPPELELKDLPSHLEYAFLEGTDKLPVIIAKNLKDEEKERLIKVLKSHKQAIAWKLSDIKVIKKEVIKLLDAGLIYPISDSPWVSPVHCVPKKGGMTVVTNENNELIPTRLVTGWRVCIDYRKLNDATRKDHFPLPFMDQMLERLAGNEYYCFLDGFSGYFQIPIDPQDQEKTTFTCPYGTFAYRRMPFGLCNAPGTFQRQNAPKVRRHQSCSKLGEVPLHGQRGIVLGHKISKSGIEVDRAKVDVIAKLPPPTSVKGIQSFLGHAGFYRRFIQDFSKIARPMTHLLEKETPFIFSTECREAFETLKKKLTEALILVAPDWDFPFEIMCDASDFVVGAVLGQRKTKHFKPIHYASKTMTESQTYYTNMEKELLAVVYAFEKFRPYLVLSKTIVYTDYSALKYLLAKQDAKPRLLR